MTRYLTIFGVFICFLWALSTSAPAGADSPASYRIAVIIPLSGNVASLGNYVKEGIDLAYEALPKELREKITLVYEDDQFDPVKTVTAYRRLAATDGADAVFVIGSPPANALSPILEKEKKILVAIGASDPTIAIGKTYSFIHWVIPPVLGEALADELSRRKLQRIALVAAEASGTIADVDAAVASLERRNMSERIVYRQTFAASDTDFRSTLQQMRLKKVDAVVAVLFPGALSSFTKQFRSANIPAELVGMETFEDESEVKAAGGSLEGAWYVNASASVDWFTEAYRKKYGKVPGWGSANGYDSLQLLSEAVGSGKRTSDEVRDFLRNVKDFSGASGKFSSSGDNRFTLPAALKKISNGKFVALEAVESGAR